MVSSLPEASPVVDVRVGTGRCWAEAPDPLVYDRIRAIQPFQDAE